MSLKMNEFEEWFKKNYGELYKDTALQQGFKELALKAWNAALERQWQPIETAPRDGTEILLTCIINDMAVCKWSKELNFWTWGMGKEFASPTHWQPLPQPPKEKS